MSTIVSKMPWQAGARRGPEPGAPGAGALGAPLRPLSKRDCVIGAGDLQLSGSTVLWHKCRSTGGLGWATRAGGLLRRGDLVSSEEGTVARPEGLAVPPVETGGDLDYIQHPLIKWGQAAEAAFLGEANLPRRLPLPKRRCSAVRSQEPESSWTYSGNRAQARSIRCALSTSPKGRLAPEGDLENERRARSTLGVSYSVPSGTRPLHRRRTGSGGLPEGNDLLVGRVNPPAEAGACKQADFRGSRVRSEVDKSTRSAHGVSGRITEGPRADRGLRTSAPACHWRLETHG